MSVSDDTPDAVDTPSESTVTVTYEGTETGETYDLRVMLDNGEHMTLKAGIAYSVPRVVAEQLTSIQNQHLKITVN
jgi:hypothetical protein